MASLWSIRPNVPRTAGPTLNAAGSGAAALLLVLQAGGAWGLPMSYAGSTTMLVEADPHWSVLSLTRALDRRNGLGASFNYLPVNNAHNAHDAPAAGDAGSHQSQGDEGFVLLDGTRLLHRWNLPRAQANLWLFAGIGAYAAKGSTSLVIREQTVTTTSIGSPSPTSVPIGHPGHPGGLPKPTPAPGATSTTSSVQIAEILTTPASLRLAVRPGLQFDAETTRLRFESRAMLYLASGIQRPLLTATAGAALSEPNYERVQPWLEFQVRAMPGVVDQLELIPKLRLLHQRVVLEIGYSNLGSVVGGFTYTF